MKNAPSPRLVFTYLAGGLLSFLFLGAWSTAFYAEWGGFFANTRFLAWVHLAVLGWINLIIFGVLFQFIPVVLDVKLGSERLAWWQLFFYVPGAAGMILCFWFGRLDWPLHSFASLLWLGFFLFIWNMFVTYRAVIAWTLTARFVYAAVLYLLVTILLGLFLSIQLTYPMVEISHLILLKLHAHTGMAGWLSMIVMGVSMKLLPMFLLSHDYSTKPGEAAFYLVNAGLIAWGTSVLFSLPGILTQSGALMLVAGIVCYLYQASLIFRKRNRVRSDPFRRKSVRRMDFPLRFAAVSLFLLGVIVAVALVLVFLDGMIPAAARNRLVLLYGAAIFLGFFSLLTQALLYKIIPFLVWLKKFSHSVGRVKTPKIDDLVPQRSAVLQLFLYCVGTGIVLVALAGDLRGLGGIGALLIFLSSCWLAGNLVTIWKRAVPLGTFGTAARCEGGSQRNAGPGRKMNLHSAVG